MQGENVLIEGSGHVVLADFGVTAVMEQAESNPKATRRGRDVVCRDSASSHEVSLFCVVLLSPSHSSAVVCRDLAPSHRVNDTCVSLAAASFKRI